MSCRGIVRGVGRATDTVFGNSTEERTEHTGRGPVHTHGVLHAHGVLHMHGVLRGAGCCPAMDPNGFVVVGGTLQCDKMIKR